MKLFVLVFTAALAALELPVPVPQERPPEFVIGVLRRDGIAAPFGVFDGRRWRARWPDDVRNRELPITLDDVPESWWGVEEPPRAMTIWRDGQRKGSVNFTGVSMTRPMCEPRITLKSDYKPASPPPPFERPYPKDGLLVSADVALEPVGVIEKDSAEWTTVAALIADDFNREETIAARSFSSWTHPLNERQRRGVPITIEALYRAPTGDPNWTAYYVEMVRQFQPGSQDKDGCGLATFGHGWILSGPKRETKVRISAKVTYCDRKGVSYMLPFGTLRANDKVYWLYQFSGFEEEWYEVAEPTRNGVTSHVSYRAGFCPQ